MTDKDKSGNDKSDSKKNVDKDLVLNQRKEAIENEVKNVENTNKIISQQSKEKKSTENNAVKTKKISETKKETIERKESLFNAKPIPKMGSAKSRKASWFSILTFILLIVLFSFSAWMFYQQQLSNESLQSIKIKVNTDLETQNSKVASVVKINNSSSDEINQIKKALLSLANQNNDLKLQLLSAQEKIKSLSGRRKQDWMLAEVEYLINIAELKLSLQKDRNTAIQLLKTADERIIEISDQSLLPIREAIARDVSNLSLIQESDITGIVISLNTLDQQIEKLELLAFKFDETLEGKKTEIQNQETKDGEQQIDNSLPDFSEIYKRFVKEFIVIKNHAETPQPLMTPKQRANLNRNIQLSLQQAQISALQGNEKLYQLNLNKAIKWIVQYFGQGIETSAIIIQLEELRTERIDVRYPTKLESSTAIQLTKKNQLYNWLDHSLNPATQNKVTPLDIKQEVGTEGKQETEEANKQ